MMSLAKQLEEAAKRLTDAGAQITEAREKPQTPESLRQWLEALTDYCEALADVHTYNNESIHEKLHEIAGRAGVVTEPVAGRRGE